MCHRKGGFNQHIFKLICLDIKAHYTVKQYETLKAECAIQLQGTINPIIMYTKYSLSFTNIS
jgi:hypothetical protein